MQKIFYLLFFTSSFFCIVNSQPLEEFRAVKITNVDSEVLFSDERIAEAMDYLASIGVNAVLPVVWNGGYTQYQSQLMDSLFGQSIHPQFAGRDPLERLIIEAHRVGIEVYPWFEYGFAAWYSGGNPERGGPLLQKFPTWALRTRDGRICNKEGFDWMSAINPEVQRFMNTLVNEVITKYDVDGVEFSDRIPAMPVEGGYDSATVAIFRSEHSGNTPPQDVRDPDWMRWRADKLNQWFAEVRALIKKRNPNLFVSSSPLLYPSSYQEYLQDTQSWLRDGIIDQFIPQWYFRTFEDYSAELKRGILQVPDAEKQKVYAGMMLNIGVGVNAYVMSPDYVLQALKLNRENGLKGEAFFYYEGLRKKNNQLGKTIKAAFYRTHALVPGRNKKQWRPAALIVYPDDIGVKKSGTWENVRIDGKSGKVLCAPKSEKPAAISYSFSIQESAVYDIYFYGRPDTILTSHAVLRLETQSGLNEWIIDQCNMRNRGWQKLGTSKLRAGMQATITQNNSRREPGKYLAAFPVMLVINRMMLNSPDLNNRANIQN